MKAISTYNISKLSGIFSQADSHGDFLFIGEEDYTPSIEEPFRTDTYAIAFLKQGQIGVTAGLTTGVVTAPSLLTIGPYVIRSIHKVENAPRVDLIFFKESFFLENQSNIYYLLKYGFFENEDSHVLPLSEENVQRFSAIYDLLRATIREGHPHTNDIIRSYLNILLCETDAAAARLKESQPGPSASTHPLLVNFKHLLSKEVLQQHSVRFYASHLNVTPKYLSEVIKEQTGRTAGEWIDQTLVLEAKVLLQRKDLTISQISDLLHFSDQSVFGKFFKVNTGMSPLTYRNALT
ncbi:helix-turn-helix domain-containing protein [Chitinophaga ginsengisoli]|uniref:AraC-like DNA-binding protein n=1 Tax=Chitinophaga ginsengisoli TaxID=363837 RepID=A0A2P8FMW4_9BACT|nr:AraC family transcriptional regulator [Chitinophaga ginsengisoli]PSL23078.1 AraC-like DNA-binding protein [Chitinophaga ginsengisoli]